MHKLQSLRDHLLTAPATLKIEPDLLLTYADKGVVISSPDGTNEHYEFKYNANIIIENFAGQSDQLTYWVLTWLAAKQPNHTEQAFEFQADHLNDKAVDIALTIPLTETIKVSRDINNDIVLHHADDPSLKPVLLPAVEWSLFIQDDPNPIETWLQDG